MVENSLLLVYKRLNWYEQNVIVELRKYSFHNKSQGQSFEIIGVDLQSEVFSHGEIFVKVTPKD